ncbi:hypothetical protein [Streptococcus acidominimus]|nr:hypothetical protein [Streptococcus acidominimus]MBF0819214.1 hypothetical protein [Streptococcus acidominimus]MBF0837837.1 hypothetical protein [Streptococcus acidominimus]MBF0847972.1 hypothetical protein [Streptococcus danieliae]TFU30220.1 hypothetical protein E4U01_07135 [Streptococcus acidominimus]
MAFSLNDNIQKNKEAERNRKYEVSLVKALKNSYRDLGEIKISSPDYSVPPGDWSCTVQLSFSDGLVMRYGMSHSLSNTINRSAVVTMAESNILVSRYGKTESDVKVIFSDGKESIE